VAARVRWSGVGLDLRRGDPSPAQLATAVRQILARPNYRQRAGALAAEIGRTDPVGTIVEALVGLASEPRPAA
jgi:UDP:flavonoid glycosyltransferase YjiC (YdhE family)